MPQERFSNLGESLLNGGINNSVTSLDVDSASSFPTAGNFRIKIDDEIMLVTAVSSNTFTVTRAREGTAAASHSDDAPVRHVLTAGAVAGLGKVVASGSASVANSSGNANAVIDLSTYGITQGMANLFPLARVHERADGSSAGDPGDIWAVMEIWFKRDDGASSGVPDDLRIRTRRLTGAASGYNLVIDWIIFELP